MCYKCSDTTLKLKGFCNWDEKTLKRRAHEKLTFWKVTNWNGTISVTNSVSTYTCSVCEESELFASHMGSESLEDCTKLKTKKPPWNTHQKMGGVTTASVSSIWICKELWKVRQRVLILWKIFISPQVNMLAKISSFFLPIQLFCLFQPKLVYYFIYLIGE